MKSQKHRLNSFDRFLFSHDFLSHLKAQPKTRKSMDYFIQTYQKCKFSSGLKKFVFTPEEIIDAQNRTGKIFNFWHPKQNKVRNYD